MNRDPVGTGAEQVRQAVVGLVGQGVDGVAHVAPLNRDVLRLDRVHGPVAKERGRDVVEDHVGGRLVDQEGISLRTEAASVADVADHDVAAADDDRAPDDGDPTAGRRLAGDIDV